MYKTNESRCLQSTRMRLPKTTAILSVGWKIGADRWMRSSLLHAIFVLDVIAMTNWIWKKNVVDQVFIGFPVEYLSVSIKKIRRITNKYAQYKHFRFYTRLKSVSPHARVWNEGISDKRLTNAPRTAIVRRWKKYRCANITTHVKFRSRHGRRRRVASGNFCGPLARVEAG